MSSPSLEKELPVMDSMVNRVLDYIREQRAISFDELYDYMVAKHLRFSAAANPIELLDLVAHRTGTIDVDYDERMIYGRRTST